MQVEKLFDGQKVGSKRSKPKAQIENVESPKVEYERPKKRKRVDSMENVFYGEDAVEVEKT